MKCLSEKYYKWRMMDENRINKINFKIKVSKYPFLMLQLCWYWFILLLSVSSLQKCYSHIHVLIVFVHSFILFLLFYAIHCLVIAVDLSIVFFIRLFQTMRKYLWCSDQRYQFSIFYRVDYFIHFWEHNHLLLCQIHK